MGKKSREKKERREQNLKLSNEKMTPFEQCEKFNVDWRDMKERFKNSEVHKKLTDEDWQKEAERLNSDTVFLNNLYQVNIHDDGSPMLHVSIKRRDKEACHDWRHFQQIKNELIGPTHEAVEIYPSEERLVDGANQYHH